MGFVNNTTTIIKLGDFNILLPSKLSKKLEAKFSVEILNLLLFGIIEIKQYLIFFKDGGGDKKIYF